jgi:FtsX-like permease family
MQWIDDALHDTRHGWRSLRRSAGFAARTREIGMRMALGAERRNVMRLGLSQSGLLTVLGAAFGLAGSAAVTRYLQAMLFGLTPLDPATFVTVPLALAAIAGARLVCAGAPRDEDRSPRRAAPRMITEDAESIIVKSAASPRRA